MDTDEKREVTLASGVEVVVRPFPGGLYANLQSRGLEKHPDPEPPTKTVDTATGPEEIDDLTNPEYVKAREDAERKRGNLIADAILDLCVECDLSKYESQIKRLEKHIGKAPKDADELKSWFFENYAFTRRDDYSRAVGPALSMTLVTDQEVRRQLDNFPGQVERAKPVDAEARGADEEQPLDVQ